MSFGILWHLPPPGLVLASKDVHIWRIPLEQPAARVRQLLRVLSHDEQKKAECFHFDRDRRRFIVSHAALRAIVGLYLNVEPNLLQFQCETYGKPYLVEKFGGGALRFNLTHSHELGLCAFTRKREIGIDLEYIRPMPDLEQISARFFSARENAALRVIPENQRLEAFFNCWTRKEAYIKAVGDGLSRPLDQFDVSLAPGEPARLLRVEGVPGEATRWSLDAFVPDAGYVAAVVVQGHDWQVRCWQWT